MLHALPQVTALALGIHAHWGPSLLEAMNADLLDFERWAYPPALAALAALTRLEIVGAASLPPDWHQLSSLVRLAVGLPGWIAVEEGVDDDGQPWVGFTWGAAPLAALQSLTRLKLSRDALLPGGWAEEGLHASACTHCLQTTLRDAPCPPCPPRPPADAALLATAPALAEVHAPGYAGEEPDRPA
jgi:hypothetical protein